MKNTFIAFLSGIFLSIFVLGNIGQADFTYTEKTNAQVQQQSDSYNVLMSASRIDPETDPGR